MLLAHEEEDYEEWGAGFVVRERGGLPPALVPSWGATAGTSDRSKPQSPKATSAAHK